MVPQSITLNEVYESLQQLKTIVQSIADDLDEQGPLSNEALAALDDARSTPEAEYVTLQ